MLDPWHHRPDPEEVKKQLQNRPPDYKDIQPNRPSPSSEVVSNVQKGNAVYIDPFAPQKEPPTSNKEDDLGVGRKNMILEGVRYLDPLFSEILDFAVVNRDALNGMPIEEFKRKLRELQDQFDFEKVPVVYTPNKRK